jgi:hypothetical protein
VSLKTWKDEFYPVEADKTEPGIEAIEHSLRKWRGLRAENLAKHDCGESRGTIYDGIRVFDVNNMSCALCFHAAEWNGMLGSGDCDDCPLRDYLGRSCDESLEEPMPYVVYRRNGDVEPMIEALGGALEMEKEKRPLDMLDVILGGKGCLRRAQ